MKKSVLFKRIVLALMLIGVIVLVSCNFRGCGNNDGDISVEDLSQSFTALIGKFTNIEIRSEEDLILALQNLNLDLGIDNVTEELSVQIANTIDNYTYYRLQQNHNGIPVYGSSLMVITNENGETQGLTGNVADIEENIAIVPAVTQEQVESSIHEYIGKKVNVFVPELTDDMLVIYTYDVEKPVLAYNIYLTVEGMPYKILVNATDATVLRYLTMSYSENSIKDTLRSIKVYDCNDEYYKTSFAKYYTSPNDSEAVNLLNLLGNTYDFFDEIIGIQGFDAKYGTVLAAYDSLFFDDNGNLYGRNAFFSPHSTDSTIAYLIFGNDIDVVIDVVAHEYMHAVESKISSMEYIGESGAIMEGYSDIFGEIVEDWRNDGFDNDCNWKNEFRNIKNPSLKGNPKKYKQWLLWADTSDVSSDNGGVHHNSTVISHAAYLMTKGSNPLSTKQLALLWYHTLHILPSNCDFENLRVCMEIVAQTNTSIGLTKKQQETVSSAFKEVGIDPEFDYKNVLPQAKIANTYYQTLQMAFDDAVDGDRITLLTDVEVSTYLDIKTEDNGAIKRAITLDLNGHSITHAYDYVASDYPLVFVGINQTLTIIGEGTISCYKRDTSTIGVYGTLNLSSGTIINAGGTALIVYYWNNEVGYDGVVGGKGYITGGNIQGIVSCPKNTTATLIIKGGSFTTDVSEYLAEGYSLVDGVVIKK